MTMKNEPNMPDEVIKRIGSHNAGFEVYAKRIFNHAAGKSQAAVEHSKEGNKYEFETCDLLIKGAGGAFFLYLSLIQLRKADLHFEAMIYFSLSLILGIWHKLRWSQKMLKIGNQEMSAHAQIISETYNLAVKDGSPEKDFKNLWEKIMREELQNLEYMQGKKLLKDLKDLKYVVPFRSYSQLPIYLQLAFILLGAVSAVGIFSLYHFICSAVVALWGAIIVLVYSFNRR